jgi:hypothetical protein
MQAIGERAVTDIGHDQVVPGALLTKVIDGQDMLVGQWGEHFGLAPEAGKVISLPAMHDFYRYLAKKLCVVGKVDLCHPTSSNTMLELVTPQSLSFQCFLHAKRMRAPLCYIACYSFSIRAKSENSSAEKLFLHMSWQLFPYAQSVERSYGEDGLAQIDSVQVDIAQIDTTEIGAPEIGIAQFCSIDVGVTEISVAEISTIHISAMKIGAMKGRPAEISNMEIGAMKISLAEIGAAKISSPEVRHTKIGPTKVGPGEIHPAKIDLLEVNKGEIKT